MKEVVEEPKGEENEESKNINENDQEQNQQEEQEDQQGDEEIKPSRNIEEDVIKLTEEKWPHVNGVYDSQGEWHDWNELTYGYSYENSELIILPYTVCIINLPGQQYVSESASN